MKAQGTLKAKMDIQRVSDRFQKREFVVTLKRENTCHVEELPPEHVSFQLQQDNCSIINDIIVGSEVEVEFDLKGRMWDGPQGIKYFNTLEAVSVQKI